MPLSHRFESLKPKYPGYGDFQVFRGCQKTLPRPKAFTVTQKMSQATTKVNPEKVLPLSVCCVRHDLAQGRVNQDCALLTCFCGVVNYSSAALHIGQVLQSFHLCRTCLLQNFTKCFYIEPVHLKIVGQLPRSPPGAEERTGKHPRASSVPTPICQAW